VPKKTNKQKNAQPEIDVIIETPKGRRNKFKFDEKTGKWELSGVLPRGMMFPFDFGFIPNTTAEDGDPLDVMILMDEPAFVGCYIKCRILGVLEAEQTEDGKTFRNDRILAVPVVSHDHAEICDLTDVQDNIIKELEDFFTAYNRSRGKGFKGLGTKGPDKAYELIAQSKKPGRKTA
jgi:inorganic pyrophosphatase